MHYGRYAFSKNREPTIIPIPNSNVEIGRAKQMSRLDILRINKLYGCGKSM
uniref:Peptidase M12A domain-containing protein n=1 Tax=Anguilla anguilla TaxID=7936 RepID=A0A0E9XMX5_ANGAN